MRKHSFTKILIMVEHEGTAYGVDLPSENLEKMLHAAAALSKNKTLALSPMPNQKAFDVVFQKAES